jgi:hypothetical protein
MISQPIFITKTSRHLTYRAQWNFRCRRGVRAGRHVARENCSTRGEKGVCGEGGGIKATYSMKVEN